MLFRSVIFSLVFICTTFSSRAQPATTPLSTTMERVTVFTEGAQIERSAALRLPAGKTTLVIRQLSPFLDPGSISVRGTGDFVILGVNHRRNFLEQERRTESVQQLVDRKEELIDSITLEQNLLSVWSEEEEFLRENRNIKGEDNGYELTDLQAIGTYYVERMRTIKREQLAGNKRIEALQETVRDLERQISELESRTDYGWSEVYVQVEAERAVQADFAISYLAGNAGWIPVYDLWVDEVGSDVRLVYQANLRQETKEDWEDVILAFSNAEPNQSGQAPTLFPYFLQYGYGNRVRQAPVGLAGGSRPYTTVYGRVIDQTTGEPLIGVSVMVPGSTIGTMTDLDGNYSLTLPASATNIEMSYVGYQSQVIPLTNSPRQDVYLSDAGIVLDAVVVTGAERVKIRGSRAKPATEEAAVVLPVSTVEYSTSVEFVLDNPYTIVSGNETVKLDLQVLNIPAQYEYVTVPKLDENAYLLATITDWEQYNLLDGEVSLHFEDNYVGKSVLTPTSAGDTLALSLGRDQGISVERENIRDFSRRTFLGGKQIERRHFRINLRNNKRQSVRMVVRDQIPLSTNKDIEVESLESSGARLDKETGELVWEIDVAPGATLTLDNKYEVKFSKGKAVNLE